MRDDQLLRYSRQIMLPQVGYEGQQRLLEARVLIVGVGGLGSPVAMYLAAAGVGGLTVADFDDVELTNLQRQIIHTTADIGHAKVASARATLMALNPDVTITTMEQRLDPHSLKAQAAGASLVIDCSDNFATRFAVNEACVATDTPLVSGAVIRMEGQVAVFHPGRGDGPCYRCLYGEHGDIEERCAETGILAPVAGIIGSIQATEALKIILNIGEPLVGRLLVLDAVDMTWREVRLRRDPHCPVCSA